MMSDAAAAAYCCDIGPTELEQVLDGSVFFATGKATILPQSFPLLNAVALTLKGNPEITLIEVQGHTDDRGEDGYNMELSNDRANAVRTFLIDKGITTGRLRAKGYGETAPARPTQGLRGADLDSARSKNRRVQFKIVTKE